MPDVHLVVLNGEINMCNHAGVLTSTIPEPEPLLIPSVPVLCIGLQTHYLFHYAITETLCAKRGYAGLIRYCLYFCVGECMCTWAWEHQHECSDLGSDVHHFLQIIHGVCG